MSKSKVTCRLSLNICSGRYGDTCPSYPSLKSAFSACFNLPAVNGKYCNTLTYSEPSGETCFSYCSEDFSCGEDFVGSMTTWIRTRKSLRPEAIILQSFKMDLCIFLEDGMDR